MTETNLRENIFFKKIGMVEIVFLNSRIKSRKKSTNFGVFPFETSIIDTLFFLVSGEWSDWEDWGTCSNTCGNGTRYRTRRCDDPEPTNGGMECVGNNTQEEICNEGTCAGVIIIHNDK